MTLTLSETLKRYFAAQNAHDAEGMVACFAPEAHVRDEGHDHSGRDEILQWKKDTIAKYGISIEPQTTTGGDSIVSIVARVSGSFPGSPAKLTYEFELDEDGLIRDLRIH